ncbi:MAG: hypothetical protein ACXVGI_10195, partial [Mycobacteriaceae bacterium]
MEGSLVDDRVDDAEAQAERGDRHEEAQDRGAPPNGGKPDAGEQAEDRWNEQQRRVLREDREDEHRSDPARQPGTFAGGGMRSKGRRERNEEEAQGIENREAADEEDHAGGRIRRSREQGNRQLEEPGRCEVRGGG